MSMIPEEIVNSQTWKILQNIKEEYFVVGKNKLVKYKIGSVDIIPRDRKVDILKNLYEWRALNIVTKHSKSESYGLEFEWENATEFELEINQPKFDEIYNKYRKACDLTSHLNDYQERLMERGDKLPEFNQVENVDRNENIATSKDKTIENVYKPSEPPPNLIEWRNLVLDFNQQTICYKNNLPHELSFETKPVKLLITLFDHPRVLDYVELAQKLNLNCYHENVKNNDVAREVQTIRRDLMNILKNKVKMEAKDLNDLIVSKEKVGYKIGQE